MVSFIRTLYKLPTGVELPCFIIKSNFSINCVKSCMF